MVILVVGGLLALLAGCGGDDSPIEPVETTESGTDEQSNELSKADFIAEVDPRCAEASVAIAGLSSGTASGNLALLATQEEAITKGLLQRIRDVAASDDSGALDRYLSALQEQVSLSGRRATAADSADTATYETLGAELAQAKADALAAAGEYGFEDCGQEVTAIEPSTDGGTVAPAPAPAPAPSAPSDGGGTSGGSGGGGSGGGSGGGDSGGSGGVSPG